MSRSRRPTRTNREFWASRLHVGGEIIGRFTKFLTHKKERRQGKEEAADRLDDEGWSDEGWATIDDKTR